MSKKTIIIILLLLLTASIVSLYQTFAFNEENTILENSQANYNLTYLLKENKNKSVSLAANEEKYIDIDFVNTYDANVKYGIYYYLVKPNNMPDNVYISKSDESKDPLEDIVKPKEIKTVSIKVTNNSNEDIELIIGPLIGFENGNIEELLTDGEVLIK